MKRSGSDLGEFYWLHDPADESAFSGIAVSGGIEEETIFETLPIRPGLQLYACGLVVPRRTVEIKKTTGWRNPSSVVWVQLSCVVIRESLLTVLRPFSGWSSYRVHVDAPTDEDYAGLAIWGRSGMTSMSSNVEVVDDVEHYVGMRFDASSWDGSDIFYASSGRGPIVTERVKNALLAANVLNVGLMPLRDVRSRVAWYHEMRSRSPNPEKDPAFNDPLRPYMFRLRSTRSLDCDGGGTIVTAGLTADADAFALLGPGIRIVVFDAVNEVDAIVQHVSANGEVSALPIRLGHGSLRPRTQ